VLDVSAESGMCERGQCVSTFAQFRKANPSDLLSGVSLEGGALAENPGVDDCSGGNCALNQSASAEDMAHELRQVDGLMIT
jgi:hypothetical protein